MEARRQANTPVVLEFYLLTECSVGPLNCAQICWSTGSVGNGGSQLSLKGIPEAFEFVGLIQASDCSSSVANTKHQQHTLSTNCAR